MEIINKLLRTMKLFFFTANIANLCIFCKIEFTINKLLLTNTITDSYLLMNAVYNSNHQQCKTLINLITINYTFIKICVIGAHLYYIV